MMLVEAIDIALETLELNKLCRAVEDDEAYYFTGCGDNGEPIFAATTVRVYKDTLKCEPCYYTDKCWNSPKSEVAIPKERQSVFIERKEIPWDLP